VRFSELNAMTKSYKQSSMQDPIEMLLEDHKKVQTLFNDFNNSEDETARKTSSIRYVQSLPFIGKDSCESELAISYDR
jgi:hypothetical protein